MTARKHEISFDYEYYKPDSIRKGRLIKKFFEKLVTNVFDNSIKHYDAQESATGKTSFPLLYTERNLYSLFAAAIHKITPIHLSEWSLNDEARTADDPRRRVDFWCLVKDGPSASSQNFFIELKKAGYCLSEGTDESFTATSIEKIGSLVDQISVIKKLNIDWLGDGNVYLGILVIHAYRSRKKVAGYSDNDVRDILYCALGNKLRDRLLFSTWRVPTEMEIQWDSDVCEFVSIAGIAATLAKH